MRLLVWSRMQSGVLNGKVGPYHLFSVAFHTGENRYFVAPKLKGQKTVPVGSEAEGVRLAERLYQDFLKVLAGG
jgi:hypothetical protein